METINKNPVWMNRVTNFSSLKGIGEKMIEQDNLATSYPLFEVKENQRLYGVDPELHEDTKRVYIVDGIEVDVGEILKDFNDPSSFLFESKEHFEDFKQFIDFDRQGSSFLLKNGDAVRIDYYVNVPTTVTTFFTNEAAKDYITRNSHQLNDPFVFVSSAYDNPEMKAIMEFMVTSKEFKRIIDEETNVNSNKTKNTFKFDDYTNAVPAHRHANGGGWVANTAHVDDTAYVGPNARVFGNAEVFDRAQIYDDARVSGKSKVLDKSLVYGKAQVFGNAQIYDYAQVYGNAIISDNAQVFGHAQVFEIAQISDNARILDDAQVYGFVSVCEEAAVYGEAHVYEKAQVYGNANIRGKSKVFGHAQVLDNAGVYDNAQIFGDAKVCGDAQIGGYMQISDTKKPKLRP